MRRAVPVGVFLLLFCAGFALSQTTSAEGPLYVAEIVVSQETPYNGGTDGIQFFGLQRVASAQIDQATLSIDANLPLAASLRAAKGKRVKMTLEIVQPRTVLELKR